MSDICLGIDLGTTYSVISYYNTKTNQVEVIPNSLGDRTTASVVNFNNTDRIIGNAAKNLVGSNPTQTIYDAKRMIGRNFDDPIIQEDIKHWAFQVNKSPNNKPVISVKYKDNNQEFKPEEISAMILTYLKECAEAFLGTTIKDVIITVPAYFNDAQRRATKDAGTIAGLNVKRILNEPTAAAIAYGLDKSLEKNKTEKTVVIVDYGGGTLDITLLMMDDGLLEVKATSGDTHLGGEDLDNKIVDWCVKEFGKQNKDIDCNLILSNKRALGKLKTAAEKAKKILSSTTSTNIEVDSLFDSRDFQATLSRAKFEQLCMDDFKKVLEPIDKVLKDARKDKTSVDDIVLVGGSTRIPKISEMLTDYFGKPPKKELNPDEAVSIGAALQGAILAGVSDKKTFDLVLIDVTPLSLGIETSGGIMTKLIPRNTIIPSVKEQVFSTYSDSQPCVTVKIYEGEREFTKDNNLLGTFELSGIPPMPRGVPKIFVKFELDTNGILQVSASEESTGKSEKIIIKNDKNRFTSDELISMIDNAAKMAEDDKIAKRRIEAKNELESFLYNIRNVLDNVEFKNKLGEENTKKVSDIITEAIQWLDDNRDLTEEEYKNKQKDVDNIVKPIVMTAYQK